MLKMLMLMLMSFFADDYYVCSKRARFVDVVVLHGALDVDVHVVDVAVLFSR